MVNWDCVNLSLRRLARAFPLCGAVIVIAAAIFAVIRRDFFAALAGVSLGLIVLELGLLLPEPAAPPEPPKSPASAPDRPLYCPHCGARRAEGEQKFCASCGKTLDA